jgi:hypothetical protein
MRGRSKTDWWGVVLDPAGRPFCLYLDEDEDQDEGEDK